MLDNLFRKEKEMSVENGTIDGKVAWFGTAGFGFLVPDGVEDDDKSGHVFCHWSSLEMEGFKTLKEGQRVSFSVVETEKGKQAENVVVV